MIDVGEAAGLLAKLPQPAAEHIRAIGASVPGRLLGRTAALLVLLALLLGWYALAARLLPAPVTTLQATYPALFNGVFFGLPLLIVAAQLTNEWLQHRRARRMQERVLRGEVRDPGYFRLIRNPADQCAGGLVGVTAGHQAKRVAALITSGMASRVRQRSLSAASRSFSVAKCLFATASSASGQRCSAGCSSGV